MSVEQLKEDVSKWILEWVSVYNEQLEQVPCPYAKAALLDGKINWMVASNIDELRGMLKALPLSDLKDEVLIIGLNRKAISVIELTSTVHLHNELTLMPHNIVALEDHPDDEEFIDGVKMNQGTWALVLIQRLDKINKASKILEAQGYYKHWSQEELDDVVTWRFKKEKE